LFNTDEGTLREISLPITDIGYATRYAVANGHMVLICARRFSEERYFLSSTSEIAK